MNKTLSDAPLQPKNRQTTVQLSVLFAIAIAHLLVDIMTNVVPLMLTLMQEAFALSYTQLGVIVMVNMICTSLIQPLFGYMTDKKPIFWLMPLGVLTTGLGLVLFAFSPSYIWLLVGVAISGMGAAAFHPEAGRTVYLSSGYRKGFGQSVFQVGGNIGQSLAPLMVPLFLVYTGIRGAWLFIFIALIATILVYRLVPWLKENMVIERKVKTKGSKGDNRTLSTVLLTVVTILRSTVVVGLSSFLPLYYVNILKMEIGFANTFIFVFMLAGSIGTFFGGPAADKLGNKRVFFWTMLVSIPFLIWLPYTEGIIAFVVIALLGFILVSTTAISVVYGQKLMPGNVGMITGLMIGFAYGIAGVGITLLGSFADIWGVEKVFPILTVLLITGFVLTVFLPKDEELEERSSSIQPVASES